MSKSNKRNILYFEAKSMKKLFKLIDKWQKANKKRLLSVNVQKDGDVFCCIALTNPSEVTIVGPDGSPATVFNGHLYVAAR